MSGGQLVGAGLMFLSAFLSAVSQILLKQSAEREHASALREYLNWRVALAYGIFAGTVVLNVVAYRELEYKYGAVIMASAYVFVLVLSRLVLGERAGWRCYAGNALIVAGICVYLAGGAS